MDSTFIIYFEAESDPIARVEFLGFDARSTIRSARRSFSAAVKRARPEVAVYHGMWGMPYLADLDQCDRRLLVLHGETPGMEEALRFRREWVDGVLCVSEPLRETVHRCVPALEDGRIDLLPYPVVPLEVKARSPGPRGRPLVIGFCGRLVREQKRVDRLPNLCRRLDESGLHYYMEFLGDGPDRAWLETQFPDRTKFIFHGRKSGAEYWQVLGQWDLVLFVSDYEGTPIALLEALSAGVIPVYPRIHSGGESYAAKVDPDLLYEPDDFGRVAHVLKRLEAAHETALHVLRDRAREAVQSHLGDAYIRRFSTFVTTVCNAPRVSKATFPSRPFPLDCFSFRALERIAAIRRRWLRLFRKNQTLPTRSPS